MGKASGKKPGDKFNRYEKQRSRTSEVEKIKLNI